MSSSRIGNMPWPPAFNDEPYDAVRFFMDRIDRAFPVVIGPRRRIEPQLQGPRTPKKGDNVTKYYD